MKSSTGMMLLVLVLGPISASGQPLYTFALNVPFLGARYTEALGINSSTTIVGGYFDGSVTHGYVLKQDKYTTFDVPVPGNITTAPNGINDGGDIVGFYQTPFAPALTHGFILQGSVLTTLDPPGATSSFALGINNLGQIVGRFVDALVTSHGFLRKRDVFITIDVPDARNTVPWGINDLGEISGSYTGSDGRTHGFLKRESAFISFDVPFPGTSLNSVGGINNLGEIVGSYRDGTGAGHGFILANEVFAPFDFPSFPPGVVPTTFPSGINDLGEIVGDASFQNQPGGPRQELFGFLVQH